MQDLLSNRSVNRTFYYRPQKKLREGNFFTGVCDSVHRGGCLLLGGACSRGVWSRGVPAPGGLVWGVWSGGGACSGGSGLGGACSGGSGPGGVPGGDPPDSYCCGRYASYWNAFLFSRSILLLTLLGCERQM